MENAFYGTENRKPRPGGKRRTPERGTKGKGMLRRGKGKPGPRKSPNIRRGGKELSGGGRDDNIDWSRRERRKKHLRATEVEGPKPKKEQKKPVAKGEGDSRYSPRGKEWGALNPVLPGKKQYNY